MKKFVTVFLVVVVVGLIAFSLLDSNTNENDLNHEADVPSYTTQRAESEESGVAERSDLPSREFIQCLVDSGMVVYASETCPACSNLADQFGGYEAVEGLFVLCGDQGDRCSDEMQTNYVPEIQINGILFEGNRTFENFATKTDCVL
jgi:hypothetical protein